MSAVRVLDRLMRSPFTRTYLWRNRPVVGIDAGERLLVRDRGVFPWADEPVDATVSCDPDDLRRMLAGEPPVGTVRSALGERSAPPRLKQAHALLTLAALGWAGPWPDPAADPEHVRLLREALYDTILGPADGRGPLYAVGAPTGLDRLAVRVTDGVSARTVVTVGLADLAPCELAVRLPPRAPPADALRPLRAAALVAAETGAVPPRTVEVGGLALACGLFPGTPEGLPLPHRRAWLVEVRVAGGRQG